MIQDKVNETISKLAQLDAIKSRDSQAMAEANARAIEAMKIRQEQQEAIMRHMKERGMNNGEE